MAIQFNGEFPVQDYASVVQKWPIQKMRLQKTMNWRFNSVCGYDHCCKLLASSLCYNWNVCASLSNRLCT